jgi:hypothetical protein
MFLTEKNFLAGTIFKRVTRTVSSLSLKVVGQSTSMGQDTLAGYWRSDFYTRWQDYADDDKDTERYKYLEVYLADFNRNDIINWKFDNFNFKDGWKRINAVGFSLGRDRYYEFVKP